MKHTLKTLLLTGAMVTFTGGAFAEGYNTTNTNMDNRGAQYNNMQMNNQTQANLQGQLDSRTVADIQRSLRDEGYNIAVDGRMGPNTRQALRSYQSANNLNATGDFDNQTLRSLNVNANVDANANSRTQANMQGQIDSRTVADIQQSLRNEGYNIAVDGQLGPNTRQALRSHQSANNLNATGDIDNRTLQSLDIDANRR